MASRIIIRISHEEKIFPLIMSHSEWENLKGSEYKVKK